MNGERIRKVQFIIGDVAYPEIDLSDLKRMPRRGTRFIHPILLDVGGIWQVLSKDDVYTSPAVRTERAEVKEFKVLKRIMLLGIFDDETFYVKTPGMRKRKTSLTRLLKLGVIERKENQIK